MNKKILAASVAAVMMGSTGLATAELTIEDKGQLLLSPVYVGDLGHKTDITIWNTSDDNAVKAKIIFRSHCDSVEVLDFVIYLSPADVWRGTVMSDGSGPRMVTSDDSTKIEADIGQGSAWNDVVPANFPFYSDKLVARPVGGLTTSCLGKDSNDFGHFEVIGVYSIPNGSYDHDGNAATPDIVVERGMTKPDLAKIFDLSGADAHALGATSIDPTALNIAGRVDVVSMSNGARSSFNVPALAATCDSPYGAGAIACDADAENYVISNAAYDADAGSDSFIGVNMGDGLAGGAGTLIRDNNDNIWLIENALAANASQWAYESDSDSVTGVLATAPTRYRHIGSDNGLIPVPAVAADYGCEPSTAINPADPVEVNNYYSAPFALTTGSIQYVLSTFDNSENLVTTEQGATSGGVGPGPNTLPEETNYLVPNYAFESGLAWMAWAQQNTVVAGCNAYTSGMPMLVTSLRYEVESGAAVKYQMNHAVKN